MSCFNRDMVEGYEDIGRTLNDFLYEGKVKNGIKKEHTKEELEQMLEYIRKDCWDNYKQGAKTLGWEG